MKNKSLIEKALEKAEEAEKRGIKMINKLTKEQEKQLKIYRDKWIANDLSTDRLKQKENK